MSAEQLVTRVISSEAMVDSYALRTGKLDSKQWDDIAGATSKLAGCDILIDDTAGITVTGMKAKLRRVTGLGLIVIDYLGLMQSDKKTDNRVQEVSDMSRNLKLLAKELQVPVICCAQLSRGAEQRAGDSHPMLSDLRDSGAIEQDADVIMFISRDYYQDKPENENTADIIVAKNRHGGTGKVSVGWFGKYTKFTTIEDREEN
jgi:replicative DNA helicase